MANNITPKLKAFVQTDATGRVVSGTPVFRTSKPKDGNWREIPMYYRGDNPTSTTTTTAGGGGVTPTAWFAVISNTGNSDSWKACNGIGTSLVVYTGVTSLGPGVALYTDAALTTLIPYSYGAIAIDGRVYDIVNGSTNSLGGNGQVCANITTSSSTTSSTTTSQPLNFTAVQYCDNPNSPGESYIKISNFSGSSTGIIYPGAGTFSTEQDALNGSFYSQYPQPNSGSYEYGTSGGFTIGQTYWIAIQDSGNPSNKVARSITITNCTPFEPAIAGFSGGSVCSGSGNTLNLYYTGTLGLGTALYKDPLLSVPYLGQNGNYVRLYFNATDQLCYVTGVNGDNTISSVSPC